MGLTVSLIVVLAIGGTVSIAEKVVVSLSR